jgi:hypothetical protein
MLLNMLYTNYSSVCMLIFSLEVGIIQSSWMNLVKSFMGCNQEHGPEYSLFVLYYVAVGFLMYMPLHSSPKYYFLRCFEKFCWINYEHGFNKTSWYLNSFLPVLLSCVLLTVWYAY